MNFTDRTATVLVVDDEPINAEILATLLGRDYRVMIASNGRDALNVARQSPQPDLILLDIMMPGLDGFEVCKCLKSDQQTRDIPVIFITAVAGENPECQGLELGAVDYITKPFNAAVTRLRVNRHLGVRQSQLALLERGSFLSALIEHAPMAVWVLSLAQQWLLLNKNVQDWLGYESVQHANQDKDWQFIAPAYRDVYRQALQAAFDGNTSALEIEVVSQGEGMRWLGLTISALYDANGNIIAGLVLASDISERKRNDSRLRLAAQVFENAQEAILFTNVDGSIEDVNPAFVKITGFEREEVLGCKPSLLHSGLQTDEFYQQFWQSLHDNGQWRGEICNRRKNGELLPEWLSITAIRDLKGQVEHYLAVFSDITHIKQYEMQLEKTAHFDSLTGVPNRILLVDRLKQAIANCNRENKLLAVCYLDLDGFKPINDEFGHQAGDQVLIECARRISREIRELDTVARVGGDEFVVLLQNFEHAHECSNTLDRLLRTIAEPYRIDNRLCEVSASIGVTLYPLDRMDSDILIRHADQAMYSAKQSGKNRYHFFDADQDDRLRQFNENLDRIRHGLLNDEFELFYQPKVNLPSGILAGAEALIRWNHPERGLLLPNEFLPCIQQTELEMVMGEWVIERALRQQKEWFSQGLQCELSINISAHHLQAEQFIRVLQQKISAYPELPHGSLQIEILETAALEEYDKVRAVIAACKQMGISFALDDFGTGYSSLTYLRDLPTETIKIDRSFVHDMLEDQRDYAIIRGVIALAKAFNRQIVAEGVESLEHFKALAELGCHIAQGFGVARPMPATAFLDWSLSIPNTWNGGDGKAATFSF